MGQPNDSKSESVVAAMSARPMRTRCDTCASASNGLPKTYNIYEWRSVFSMGLGMCMSAVDVVFVWCGVRVRCEFVHVSPGRFLDHFTALTMTSLVISDARDTFFGFSQFFQKGYIPVGNSTDGNQLPHRNFFDLVARRPHDFVLEIE